MTELKPCPFCGKKVDEDLDDALYPTGHGWKEEGGHRYYVSYREVPKEQWCWQVLCPEVSGGCGAEVTGDSRDEAIAKWNSRHSPGDKRMRYQIYNGSQSVHCCFEVTVVDTTKPVIIDGEHYKGSDGQYYYESVCECFDMESAQLICDALNKADKTHNV